MRELNECKAEIFRRSEERIKHRKAVRSRILTACIPLCVILTFWSVFILPAMMPAGKEGAQENNNPGNNTDAPDSFISAEIAYSEDGVLIRKSLSENEQITSLYCSILDLFNEAAISASGIDGVKNENSNGSGNTSQGSNSVERNNIVITFVSSMGQRSVFTLNDNVLYDNLNKRKILLSQKQAEEFIALAESTE